MGVDTRRLSFLVLVSVFAVGLAPAAAQPADTVSQPQSLRVGRVATATSPSAASLRRIMRGLETPSTGAVAGTLRVDVELQVFGLAPAPALLEPGDSRFGAPAYGAPTHDDMLTLVTPAPFRSTAAYRRLRPAAPVDR